MRKYAKSAGKPMMGYNRCWTPVKKIDTPKKRSERKSPAPKKYPINNKTCPVCKHEIKKTDSKRILPCQHRFHSICIRSFRGQGCPSCSGKGLGNGQAKRSLSGKKILYRNNKKKRRLLYYSDQKRTRQIMRLFKI